MHEVLYIFFLLWEELVLLKQSQKVEARGQSSAFQSRRSELEDKLRVGTCPVQRVMNPYKVAKGLFFSSALVSGRAAALVHLSIVSFPVAIFLVCVSWFVS